MAFVFLTCQTFCYFLVSFSLSLPLVGGLVVTVLVLILIVLRQISLPKYWCPEVEDVPKGQRYNCPTTINFNNSVRTYVSVATRFNYLCLYIRCHHFAFFKLLYKRYRCRCCTTRESISNW